METTVTFDRNHGYGWDMEIENEISMDIYIIFTQEGREYLATVEPFIESTVQACSLFTLAQFDLKYWSRRRRFTVFFRGLSFPLAPLAFLVSM